MFGSSSTFYTSNEQIFFSDFVFCFFAFKMKNCTSLIFNQLSFCFLLEIWQIGTYENGNYFIYLLWFFTHLSCLHIFTAKKKQNKTECWRKNDFYFSTREKVLIFVWNKWNEMKKKILSAENECANDDGDFSYCVHSI